MSKERLKLLFRQHNLEVVLWNLWKCRAEFADCRFKLVCATTVAIEFCETGSYEESYLPEIQFEQIIKLIEEATAFCVNNDRRLDISNGNETDGIFLLIKALANQLAAVNGDAYYFARPYVLFCQIARGISVPEFEADLPNLFANEKGYRIEEYLRSCFLAFSAISAKGKFDDEYLALACRTINAMPTFEVLNQVLYDISFSSRGYRRKRRDLNPMNCFGYHPLLERPIIKPWSNIPKNSLGKRYVAPLPSLISEAACSGVYHYFVTKYGNQFNSFFGKSIFEPYVGKFLEACLPDRMVDEEELRSMLGRKQGVKLVDFVFLQGDYAILVECKAYRFPRRVYTHGRMEDCRSTFEKLKEGLEKFSSFEGYFADKDLLSGKRIIRLLVTYESLIGMDGGLLDGLAKNFLTDDQVAPLQKLRSQTCILSCAQLDPLQPLLSDNNTFGDVLLRLLGGESLLDVMNHLKDDRSVGFDQSWLWPVFCEVYEPIFSARSDENEH